MAGTKRRFSIAPRTASEQRAEDFAAVFAGDLASRPSVPLDLALDAIEPSPFQARETFDDLDELVAAIQAHGFTSRIRVRPHPRLADRYQLVFGERRLRAARMAGMVTIPVEVAEHSDSEVREIGLTENLLRRDLSALEEGRAFVQALQAGYSVRSLSARIGKASKGYVENRIAVARAPHDVQAMVEQRPDTLRAARAITALESEQERQPLIAALLNGTLTANDVDAVVREQRARRADGARARQAPTQTLRSEHESSGEQHATPTEKASHQRQAARSASRRQRATEHGRNRVERDIVEVLTLIGSWRATPPANASEREALGQGIARILAELDALVRSLEDAHTG